VRCGAVDLGFDLGDRDGDGEGVGGEDECDG